MTGGDFLDGALFRAGAVALGPDERSPLLRPRPRALFEPTEASSPGLVGPSTEGLVEIDTEASDDRSLELTVGAERTVRAQSATPGERPFDLDPSQRPNVRGPADETDRAGVTGRRGPARSTAEQHGGEGRVQQLASDSSTGSASDVRSPLQPMSIERDGLNRGSPSRRFQDRADGATAAAVPGDEGSGPFAGGDQGLDSSPPRSARLFGTDRPDAAAGEAGDWGSSTSAASDPTRAGSSKTAEPDGHRARPQPTPTSNRIPVSTGDSTQDSTADSTQVSAANSTQDLGVGESGLRNRAELDARPWERPGRQGQEPVRPVHITIGRIEVATPAPTGAPAPVTKPAATNRRPRYRPPVSLDEYLRS